MYIYFRDRTLEVFFMLTRLILLSSLILCVNAVDEPYVPGPDSQPQPGVPKGQLIKDTFKSERDIFPGTEREYTLYLPAGLDATKPAPFMVFQDGVIYQAPTVFGGKDLSELHIICNDAIYKRQTKACGLISGQMAPVKPPAPKL
jgi:hypothetical protein